MSESHRAVMREVALDQDMTVEALHLRDREYTDTSEGMGTSVVAHALRMSLLI